MGDLNGLLRALRDEIAFAGNQGAAVEDILAGIDQFYLLKAGQQHDAEPQRPVQNVDRSFKERVWSWLVKDQLVFVGRSKEGNSLSLREVEARNLEKDPLRVFTTERQIWITLTGHEKDNKKVPAKSFELLEVIAAQREKGIMQPDLVRITGQDKRSVPLRTQKLAETGYIKKIKVLANQSNTSLLVLSRFSSAARQDHAVQGNKSKSSSMVLGHNRFARVEKEIRTAVQLLEDDQNHLMVWNDLRSKCEAGNALSSRLLAEGFRRLEELGIVVRVRASSSNAEDKKKRYFRCVQLLRSLTEKDWHVLFEMTKTEQNKFVDSLQTQDMAEEPLHFVSTNPVEVTNLVSDAGSGNENIEPIFKPSWDPDRLLAHTILSALLEAGTTGLSTKDLKRIIVGPCYSRPIDRFLDHCVKVWQISQPAHLRHLAIIRDSAQTGKTSFYVHFAHDAFGVKVFNGETLWDAVYSLPEPSQTAALDEYGFEILSTSIFAGVKNDLTLKQTLQEADDSDWRLSMTEGDTTYTALNTRPQWQSAPKAKKAIPRTATQGDNSDALFIPVGRPRKYPVLGAALDFSGLSPEQIKKVVTSQKRAQEYLRKKAHKEVEARVAFGIAKDVAEASVIAALGLTPESYLRNTIKEPDERKTQGKSRPRGKRHSKEQLPYLPSILAHTIPVYQDGSQISEVHETIQATTNPLRIAIGYFPSTLFHTRPIYLPPTQGDSVATVQHRDTLRSERRVSMVEALGNQARSLLPVSPRNTALESDHVSQDTPSIVDSSQADQSLITHNGSEPQTVATNTTLPFQESRSQETYQTRMPPPGIVGQSYTQTMTVRMSPSLLFGRKRKSGEIRWPNYSPKRQRYDSMLESSVEVLKDDTINREHISTNQSSVSTGALVTNGFEVQDTEDTLRDSSTSTLSNTQPSARPPPAKVMPLSIRQTGSTAGKNMGSVNSAQQRSRFVAFDGTISAMRKLIILDIVKNCQGLCPGDVELVPPFQTAYMKKFPGTKPDAKTIKNAKNTLVGEGKLKQIFFTCKSTSGAVFTKSIIASPEISDIDERVKDLQQAMTKAHPLPYYPPGIDIRLDLLPRSLVQKASSIVPVRRATYLKDLPLVSGIVVRKQYPDAGPLNRQESSPAGADRTESGTPPVPVKKARGRPRKIRATKDSLDISESMDLDEAEPRYPESNVASTASIAAVASTPSALQQSLLETDTSIAPDTGSPILQQNLAENDTSKEPNTKIPVVGRKNARQGVKRGPYKKRKTISDGQPEDQADGARKKSRRSATGSEIPPQTEDSWMTDQLSPAVSQLQGITPMFTSHPSLGRGIRPDLTSEHLSPVPAGRNETVPSIPEVSLPVQTFSKPSHHYGRVTQEEARDSTHQTASPLSPFVPPFNSADGPATRFLSVRTHVPVPLDDASITEDHPTAAAATKDKIVKGKKRDPKQLAAPPAKPAAKPLTTNPASPQKIGNSHKKRGSVGRAGKPKLSALELHQQKQEKTPGIRFSKSSQTTGRPIQTRRERYFWSLEEDRELLVAVLLSQIVWGGLREENNWAIVSQLLGNRSDRDLCRRRWAAIKGKHLAELERMSSDLRSATLDAYESGELPTIDYAQLSETDWEGILAWALRTINNPVSGDIELPVHREAFESAYSIQDLPSNDLGDFFENRVNSSITARNKILNNGTRLLTAEPEPQLTDMDMAKTHVLANVYCQDQDYDGDQAREMLLRFPAETIEQATNQLLADKVINYTNRGRAAPGRTLDISPMYLRSIQGKFSVSHFKYAAVFKGLLDDALDTDGRMLYKPAFGDGEIVTIFNLLASGMVRLEGEGIPDNKFGLATGGCTTRNMDKQIFNFETFIRPTEGYIPGLPCRPFPEPPRTSSNGSGETSTHKPIPCWRDIHDNLLPLVWDLVLSAVITVLITNTSANAQQIAKQLKPSVADFEIRLIMQWLVQAGAAEWTEESQDRLNLTAWWWSIITTPINKITGSDEATMIAGVQVEQ